MSEWRDIESHRGIYEVSRDGRVRHKGGAEIGRWISAGYVIVRLSRPRVQISVHRLVAAAFIPNPDKLPVVNHLDHNKQNNNASNLEWCTQKHNLDHARKAGRLTTDHLKGRRPSIAALTDDTVREIRRLHAAGGWSWSALAVRFDISKRAIGRLLHRETYADVDPPPEPPQ